jgi:putative membrane protein
VNRIGLLLAAAGLAFALWIIAEQDFDAVSTLLAAAGVGLILQAFTHVPAMVLNAHAWSLLMPGAQRPSLLRMTQGVWLRESINGLLPVGRVGGELACYRVLRGWGVGVAPAAGGLMMDVALSLVSQLVFALLGIGLLAAGGAVGWFGLVLALGLGFGCAAAFIAAQRLALFSRVVGALNKVASDRLSVFAEHSVRIDRYVRRAWTRPRAVACSFAWQFAAWIAGALEIYVALRLLGHPVTLAEALVIESLIQAVSSAAFLVPGALGVQEAGFIGIGALLGIDPATSAALAVTRRIRDIVLYVPGLVAWVWAERRLSRSG